MAEYYCDTHKEVFCVTCKIVRHKACSVEALDDIVKHKSNLKQFNATIDTLNKLLAQATETETLQDVLLESLTEHKNSCEESIKAFRKT